MVNTFPGLANRKFLLFSFVLAVSVFFAILSNPFEFYFLNDDFVHIPPAAKGNFLQGNLLRPVADLTLWADSALYGKNAAGFHFTNLLVHLLNTVLVFFLYLRVQRHGSFSIIRPLIASGLFLIYAFHSESVFWIIGRGGSLACLFTLVSLNCFIYSKSALSLITALISFVLGLFTYEFVWVLPLLIFIFGMAEPVFEKKSLALWTGSFLAVFTIYFAVRLNLTGVHLGKYEAGLIQEINLNRLAYNYIATFARSFLPPMESGKAFLAVFILIASVFILVIAFYLKKERNRLMLFFGAILISCLPSISLGIDTHDQEGERFLYLSSVFCCLFLIEFVFRFQTITIKASLLALLFTVHAYYFYQSARSYRFASGLVKQSLECLGRVHSAHQLTVVNLPTQYKGALIFRKGFNNAVNWLMPRKFESITINSYMEILKGTEIKCVKNQTSSQWDKVTLRFDSAGNINME